VADTDLALIVTEPTVSGVHDLERVLDLCRHFGVPAKVVINKASLNSQQAGRIRSLTASRGVEVLAEIPFDREVHRALMQGLSPVEYGKGGAADLIAGLWERIVDDLDKP